MKFFVQKTLLNKLKKLIKYFNVHKCITLIFFYFSVTPSMVYTYVFQIQAIYVLELILKYILLNTKSKSHKNI